MGYKKEDYLNLNLDPNTTYTVVDLNLFDTIRDISLSDRTINTLEFTLDMYKDYLEFVATLSKTAQDKVLRALKQKEVINNQIIERENGDKIRSYNESHNSIAINYLYRKLYTENRPINAHIIDKSHEILMRGTSNEHDINLNYRKSNSQLVGYQENENWHVDFLPISYEDIEWALAYLTAYFNEKEKSEEEILIKPFIIHGITATLQMFEDGNTRLGRTLQHLKLFLLTKKYINNNLNTPAIYFSQTYLPYRIEYRELITKLATDPGDESWNEWLTFNLRRMQDQIYSHEQSLRLIKTR